MYTGITLASRASQILKDVLPYPLGHRAKIEFMRWLDELKNIKGMKRIIPAHFSAPIDFTAKDCNDLRRRINFSEWPKKKGNWSFLGILDSNLLKQGIVPKDPLERFKD